MTGQEARFAMANLSPALTGLAMVVWVSERGLACHDVRVRVHRAHGRQISIGNTATVAVRPAPSARRRTALANRYAGGQRVDPPERSRAGGLLGRQDLH